jgi:hypothetical protein
MQICYQILCTIAFKVCYDNGNLNQFTRSITPIHIHNRRAPKLRYTLIFGVGHSFLLTQLWLDLGGSSKWCEAQRLDTTTAPCG